MLTLACTLHASDNLILLASVFLMCAFYLTQWEEYFTGKLVLGYIGVTEAQIASMIIYSVAALEGPGFFDQTITFAGITVTYGSLPICILL